MKHFIIIILLTISFNIFAQTKFSVVPQIGVSDFYFNQIRTDSIKYRDYRNALYLGVEVSLEKELFKNFSILGKAGFTKIGMGGKRYINEFELENKIYIKEIWSTFSVYNTRISTNFEYNIGDIITVGTGIQYTREIVAYEVQQEVWLSNWYNSDHFFEKQPAFRYNEFKKNNFYGSFYLKHFVVPKIAVSIGMNIGLKSIVPIELQYHTRPFEYCLGFSFYPFKKENKNK
jgi:hypothetical protein